MAATALPKSTSRPSSGIRSPSNVPSNNPQSGGRQKSSGPANAVNGRPRSQNENATTNHDSSRDANSTDQLGHSRLVFIMATITGCLVIITLKSGEQYSGIFSGAAFQPSEQCYTLKMTKRLSAMSGAQNLGDANVGDEYTGFGDDHVKTFDVSEVVDLNATDVTTDRLAGKLSNGTSAVRTDSEISGKFKSRERELQKWQSPGDIGPELSLNGGGDARWDQFETNERLTGFGTDYDENIYTTTIDRTQPSYKQRAMDADRKAREIESSTTSNPHIAEERNMHHDDRGQDEESKYSGVKRDFPLLTSTHQNKYTPPARRAPTGQSIVTGAPVDPAIISSSFVKHEDVSSNTLKEPTLASAPNPSAQKENATPQSDANAANSVVSTTAQINETTDFSRQTAQVPNKDPKTLIPPLSLSQKPPHFPAGEAAGTPANATSGVAHVVLKKFKEFSGVERLRMQERQRTNAKREKDVKLNDLKKFAENFSLKTKVPTDMLGILAKDKKRQEEIVEKSEKQLAMNSPKKAVSAAKDLGSSQAISQSRPDDVTKTSSILPERQNTRGLRSGQGSRGYSGEHSSQLGGRTGPGSFSARLLQQPQYAPSSRTVPIVQPLPPDMQMPAPRPGPVRTDLVPRGPAIGPLTSPMFNAQAHEFKPNPTASAFSPGVAPPSPAKGVPSSSQQRSPRRASFFGEKRPLKSEKLSIKQNFNPFNKMKQEVEEEKKSKEFASNGGIPQAYRTGPTWDTPEQNKDRTYIEIFDKAPMPVANAANAGTIPHQHQLPLHLQSGLPPFASPHSQQQPRYGYPQHPPHGRDMSYEEHRMQPSSSNSSYLPSPRFQQGGPMQGSPMMHSVGPIPGVPGQPYVLSSGQPMQYRSMPPTQFVSPQAMGAQVVFQPQNGGPYMSVPPPQHMQFSPAPGQPFPMHGGTQHPGVYGSPARGPLMMVQQNSQQGHAPYMNLSNSQQGYPTYAIHQQPQMMSRNSSYMGGQQFGYSPHTTQQYSTPARGQQYGASYPQHMSASQMPPQAQQTGPMLSNHTGDVDESK